MQNGLSALPLRLVDSFENSWASSVGLPEQGKQSLRCGTEGARPLVCQVAKGVTCTSHSPGASFGGGASYRMQAWVLFPVIQGKTL